MATSFAGKSGRSWPGLRPGSEIEVRSAVATILASPLFLRAPSLARFLKFVVEQTLAGKAHELKEYTIGVCVFDRGKDFDPRVDPIVRVQAGKLRERLNRYYSREGVSNRIRIALRSGSYVPVFEQRASDDVRTSVLHPNGHVREPEAPSLAVLPFLNLTGDPGYEYFSDGLSEDLISLVGQIRGVRVIGRTSSFAFKGKDTGLPEIGRTLRSKLVLEGSVQRSGDIIRVTARLNNAPTGHQIWSRKYEGRLEDLFAVQDEITGQIADSLRESFTEDASRPQPARHTNNIDSHLLLLQAWFHFHRNSIESAGKALECFERAVALDPENAKVHAGLATAWTILSVLAAVPSITALRKAAEAARQAVRWGDDSAEAWCAVGVVESCLKWNWAESERAFIRALEINPNHVLSRHGYAITYLTSLGRMQEAIEQMKAVLDLDPLSVMASCDLATVYAYAGFYEEALRQYEAALELEPNNLRTRVERGWAMLHMDRVLEGLEGIERAVKDGPRVAAWLGMYALGLALAGRRDESLRVLDEIRNVSPITGELCTNSPVFALDALGLREQALIEFERAFERRDPHLRYVNIDPRANLLRDEPRFQILIDKMGLAGSQATPTNQGR